MKSFESHSLRECDFSDHPVSVVVVVVNSKFFDFFSQTTVRICFKVCMDVPSVDPYRIRKNQGVTPIFEGIMGNFVQCLANS